MKSEITSARPSRFQSKVHLWLSILFCALIFVMVNYLGYRHYERRDFSQDRYYELSDKTKQVIKKLTEPVRITTYLVNSPVEQQINNLLKEYEFIGGEKIKIERVNPYHDEDRARALQTKLGFGAQENLVIFEYKDRSKYLSEEQIVEMDRSGEYMGQSPRITAFKGEAQFTAAIQSLVEGQAEKIYFLTGHGERDLNSTTTPAGFGAINEMIKRNNIITLTLNLGEQLEIPSDAAAVVIAGPTRSYSATEIQILTTYLEQKGKIIILQDPQVVSGLEPLMQKYGIILHNDLVLTKVRILGNETILGAATVTEYAEHPALKAMQGVNLVISSSRSMRKAEEGENADKVTELIKTPEQFWGETNFQELNNRKVQFDENVDQKGPLCLAALYDGGEVPGDGVSVSGTRLLVIGSSSFLVNQNADKTSADFFTNLLAWMVKKEASIGISPKVPKEHPVSLTPLQIRTIGILCAVVVPAVFVIIGIIVYIRRRK